MSQTLLQQVQKAIGEWSLANFGQQVSKVNGAELGSLAPLLGLGEELGELTHAVLKRHQGIRGFDLDTVYQEARDDAVGDLLIYLMDFCNREGIDLQTVLLATAGKVLKRDWIKEPAQAGILSEQTAPSTVGCSGPRSRETSIPATALTLRSGQMKPASSSPPCPPSGKEA